jgi:hypothetical protein
VKVFLLPLESTPWVFYFEEDGRDRTTLSSRTGLRGWIERTSRRMKSTLRHPKGRFARVMKQTWDWLHRRMHPDEGLLAALRSADTIEVYHRPSLSSAEARDLWYNYLGRRLRGNLPWLVLNALLSPLSLVLTPLPGPNLIGYWFAYRAVHHLLILLGIRRVMSGRVETTFHPSESLDGNEGQADGEWLTRTAADFHLKRLHDFVERVAPRPASAAADARGGTQRTCDC